MSELRPRVLVVAALIESDGLVLLSQRRADQKFPLTWEFPGGKVEPGESPEVALIREVAEELGCTVSVDTIADVVFHPYADFDLYMLIYRCTLTAGTPWAREVKDIRWVTRGEIPALDLPAADYPTARKLAAGLI